MDYSSEEEQNSASDVESHGDTINKDENIMDYNDTVASTSNQHFNQTSTPCYSASSTLDSTPKLYKSETCSNDSKNPLEMHYENIYHLTAITHNLESLARIFNDINLQLTNLNEHCKNFDLHLIEIKEAMFINGCTQSWNFCN